MSGCAGVVISAIHQNGPDCSGPAARQLAVLTDGSFPARNFQGGIMSVIVKPVGKGGANVPTDVMVVRNLLNKFIEADISIGPLTPLPVHGPIYDTATDPTIIAIEQFQRIFVEPYIAGFKVDGRLDPWGESIAVL
jgi:hypothetical protein